MNDNKTNNQIVLDRLYEEQNNLLSRIAGVSDLVLKEQLMEEFQILESKIKHEEEEALNDLMLDVYAEHLNVYENKFVKEQDFTKCLFNTNNSLENELKNHRVRLPKSLNDRRGLLTIANCLNKLVRVIDLEGVVLDKIGKINSKVNGKKYNQFIDVYVNFFNRWGDYDLVDKSTLDTMVSII